jgi:cell division septum initiation protein DivIVA
MNTIEQIEMQQKEIEILTLNRKIEDLREDNKKLSKAIAYFRNRKDNLIEDVAELSEELERTKELSEAYKFHITKNSL